MLWLVPLLPILAAPALAAAGHHGRRPRAALIAAVAMAATAGLGALAATGGWQSDLAWSELIVLELDVTVPASALLAILVPLIAGPVLAFAAAHEEERGLGRLLGLLAVFVGAMELLVLAADLVTLLVAWELVGACSWGLIAHHWRERANPRTAAIAFLTTRAGDLGLFLAVAAAFAGAGSFAYRDLAAIDGPYLHLLVAGLLLAAAAKAGQLPFSPWLFAAMAGPVSVSALLHSATMVAAGAFLLIRLHPVLALVPWYAAAAAGLGLTTALAGGAVALVQPHAKKLLAASTSAHYGLMFTAAGAGYPGVAALHLVAHACFKAPLFLAAGVAGRHAGSYSLARMRLGRAVPVVAGASAVAALALAAVPPLGGAWTKEAVMSAAAHLTPWAAALVALAGALSAAYATRFQLLAFGRGEATATSGAGAAGIERAAVTILAGVTALLALLWVPGTRARAALLLASELPAPRAWELGLSLTLVAVGLAAGLALARRWPRLGEAGLPAGIAAWLGLPALARAGIARPALALARALAVFDDRVLDAPPRALAASGAWLAPRLAAGDRLVVDGGVRATAAFADWLARVFAHFGERIADGAPEGSARLVGGAGRDARRLQTGLSHHYYALIVLGLGALLVLLIPFALGG